jgi:archaemetzincin
MSRLRISPNGLLWAVFAAIALWGLGLPATADATEPGVQVSRRPPLVVVRTVGAVPEGDARLACRALLEQLDVRCEVRATRPNDVLAPAFDDERKQFDARGALELLFRDRAPDALVEVDLTRHDIFEAGKPFVFGLASLSDRIAIISTARLQAADPEVYAERLTKLVMHEAGHTFGLHHHDHSGCVMRRDPSVASLDEAPTTPCTRCRKRLQRRARTFARPGQLALDRARGLLVRRDPDGARQLLLGTVWAGEYSAAVLHEFGVAFQRAKQLDDAIGIFQFLVEESPDHARGHVSLGVALQARDHEGDRAQAIAHYKRALELRPEWTTVAAHLQTMGE